MLQQWMKLCLCCHAGSFLIDLSQGIILSIIDFLMFSSYSDNIYIYFLAALGLRCCARASSSCGERGLLFVAVRGLLIAVASLIAEHGL